MFQRDIFGFRNEPESNAHKRNVQRSVEPERTGSANAIKQCQEGRADNHIRHPVRGGRTGNTEIAACQPLNFRAQDPHHWRGAHRITGNTHHRHANREPGQATGSRTVIKLHQAIAQHQSA